MLRKHAFDSISERQLYSLEVAAAAELPRRLELACEHFVCLLAWDARGCSADAVSAVVEALLRAGASYFVCWGPDCERVHDIIDELASYPGNDFGVPEESCIMSSWHDSQPLGEALWFFLVNTSPDEHYQGSTRAGVAVSVGSSEWGAEIVTALDEPREFVRRGAEEEAG